MGWRDMFRTEPAAPIGKTKLDLEFELVFDKPVRKDGETGYEYRARVNHYEQKKLYFGGIQAPDFEQEAGLKEFEKYGFGPGVIYSDRYGDMVYFPNAEIGPTDLSAMALEYSGLMIAKTQSAAIVKGRKVKDENLHPYVPARIRELNARL